MLNQFKNLSCYAEFEIRATLTGISKVDVLKRIGYIVDNYYFFISKDGIFNWFDLNGNYIENPGVLNKLKVEYISTSISKCIIPDSVISIDNGAFTGCYLLKEITIPDSVTSIGKGAFYNCKSLSSISIPNIVTNIDNYTFSYCESLTSITIPDNVTDIGEEAFYNCKSLKEITIPDSATDIGEEAFYNCDSLKEVIFKGKTLEQVKQMDNYPFGIENESIIKYDL